MQQGEFIELVKGECEHTAVFLQLFASVADVSWLIVRSKLKSCEYCKEFDFSTGLVSSACTADDSSLEV